MLKYRHLRFCACPRCKTDSFSSDIYIIFVLIKSSFVIEVIEQGGVMFSAEHQVSVK